MAKSAYEQASEHYEKLSVEFTELNKRYNRAVHEDKLTDKLELEFLRAERELHAAYREQQVAKAEEN